MYQKILLDNPCQKFEHRYQVIDLLATLRKNLNRNDVLMHFEESSNVRGSD